MGPNLFGPRACGDLRVSPCHIYGDQHYDFCDHSLDSTDPTLHLRDQHLDSFDQTVNLKLNDINWFPFDDSEITLSIPEGIDVVYH